MFGLFASVERKTRTAAEQWLELADKLYHYQRDVLREPDLAELRQRTAALRQALKGKADASTLKLRIEELEPLLRRLGGRTYPKSTLVEYAEFFLVAAIVILGIRTYFVQPFKIPTNSMWPSYYGMTWESYDRVEDEPSLPLQAVRFVTQLAKPYRITAPATGKLAVDIVEGGGLVGLPVNTRKWLLFPSVAHEFTFSVNDQSLTVRVPADFNSSFQKLFNQHYGSALRDFYNNRAAYEQAGRSRPIRNVSIRSGTEMRTYRVLRVELDVPVTAGDRILSFDLLTGDQLFVDRMTYHFLPPSVGQGFVFRTGHIPDLAKDDGDKYYIKRLVGLPGDRLEIRGTTLYRNGAPITGADAFDKNARRDEKYPGYQAYGLLAAGRTLEVPEGHFFALGDNSPESRDGRSWGFVPAQEAVGRPLFIYYPFASRWGPAR